VNGLRDFGWELGLAFQMRDDMLGVWGRPEETGKPAGNDIRRRKKTLPVVYGFEKATTELRRDMIRIYSNGTLDDEAVKTVFNVLDSVDARAEVEKMAAHHIERARASLATLPIEPPARQDFEAVLGFLGERTF
jgi:geranylgeranyl diphosphate synthase type I